jgi:Tol biopolymer transport system component
VLAYRQNEVVLATVVWVDRSGRELSSLVSEPLANPSNLRFSPDGQRLALTIAGNLWIYNLDGRPPVNLTTDGVADTLLWSPDGSRLIYETVDVTPQLRSVVADGSGETPQVVSPPGHYHPQGWSAAGDRLIASVNTNSPTGWDIVTMPAGGQGESSPIVQTRFMEGLAGASLSPNHQWLAYTSNATGRAEVWIRPFPGPGSVERISPDGGTDPVWSKDGRELFYVSQGRMMAVRVNIADDALDFSTPVVLFDGPYLHRPNVAMAYDVTADGRFLMMKRATPTESPAIEVVLNWKPGQR